MRETVPKTLLTRISKQWADAVAAKIKNDATVGESIRLDIRTKRRRTKGKIGMASVLTDFFWVRWYHDGRGPVTAKAGSFLAFVKKRGGLILDPRVWGFPDRYPKKKSQVRGFRDLLPDRVFRDLVEEGVIVIAKRVGAWRGNRFFDRAFRSTVRDPFITKKIEDEAEREITRTLDRAIGTSPKNNIKKVKVFVRIKRPDTL